MTVAARLEVEGLNAGYAPGSPALREVAFALDPGRVGVVLGPNGGGKTTLLRALLDDVPWREGRVQLPGRCAYVPQLDRTRLDFPVTALDVATMGAYPRTPWWRRVARADREAARAALAQVGLAEVAGERFGTLSGGQRQRVLIARALVQRAPVILLDEAASAVDAASAERIERICRDLRAAGAILLVSTHDLAEASRWDAVLCLNGRQIAFGAPRDVLQRAVLRETYGDELVLLDGGGATVVDHGHGHHDHETGA